MKNKIIFLFVVALVFLVQQAFAQSLSQYSKSESIACGNTVCETMSFKLNVGEEKSVVLGSKTHTIKLVSMGKEEAPYPHYNIAISVDGSSPVSADDTKFKELLGIESNMQLYSFFESDLTKIMLTFREDEVCAVPDCAFKAELNVYKTWNLIPFYFIANEESLKKGSCKLQDFNVVYAYNPISNDYSKIYYRGATKNIETSASDFQRSFEQDRIWASVPFNSVWAYSNNECKLVAKLPKPFENLLLLIKQFSERTVQKPYRQGETPQPPEKIIITFAPGWNFWAGSKDMEGKNFDEIKGTCNIEKAFTFDAQTKSWKKLETAPGPSTNFIFKVTNKCMFGLPEIKPPEVPQ